MSTEISKDISQNQSGWKKCNQAWPEGQLEWYSKGEGDNFILSFPGYGNDPRMFNPVARALPKGFRLLTFQLPGFGSSRIQDLKNIPDETFYAKAIQDILGSEEKVDLLAYSIGARYVSGLINAMPERINSVVLVAPAGFGRTGLFDFSVYNPFGRWLFQFMPVLGPVWWFCLKVLKRIGVLNEKHFRFIYSNTDSRHKLETLVHNWVASSGIRPMVQELREKSVANAIKWHVIWGTKDKILPFSIAEKLKKAFPEIDLHPVDALHHPLKEAREQTLEIILDALKINQ